MKCLSELHLASFDIYIHLGINTVYINKEIIDGLFPKYIYRYKLGT